MDHRRISRAVDVDAQPEAIFTLLADPARHAEIDGSGTVRAQTGTPQPLRLGSRFRMRMHLGLPYLITNEVIEFEPNHRIAWRHWGHHVWRWILEEVADGTRVTEEFQWGTARAPMLLELAKVPERNDESIRRTLDRLQERFGAAA